MELLLVGEEHGHVSVMSMDKNQPTVRASNVLSFITNLLLLSIRDGYKLPDVTGPLIETHEI